MQEAARRAAFLFSAHPTIIMPGLVPGILAYWIGLTFFSELLQD